MSTRVRNLPTPCRTDDKEHSGENDDDTASSWDSTYQRRTEDQNVAQHQQICSHAVSVGHYVFGTNNGSNEMNAELKENCCIDEVDNQWWTWQRSLVDVNKPVALRDSGTIHALRSNYSGTVIAVASDTGVVSLLRGCDGQILASRRVGTKTSNAYSIGLAWISGSAIQQSDERYTDILLIEIPSTDEDSSSNNSQLILVANIDGSKLNDSDPSVVTEAVRHTQIIPVDMHPTSPYDLRAFAASRTSNDNILRFVACDGDSHLVTFDFNRVSQELKFVQDGITLHLNSTAVESNRDHTIDFELGFYQQIIPRESLMIFSAFVDPTAPMLVWFSPLANQTVCVYSIPQPKAPQRLPILPSKIVAMEAIASWDNHETMATAVAVKSIQKSGITTVSSVTYIYVIQVSLDDTFGLTSFGTPHVVYAIPIEESAVSLQLASFGCNGSILPYSFRYQVWTDSTNCLYKSFQTDRIVGSNIGKLRASIHSDNFQEADQIIEKIGLMSLTMELYADFHPSEIVLHRLQHTFRHTATTTSDDDHSAGILIDEIKLCLRELEHGVILKCGRTGNTLGFDIFVQAIEFVTGNVSTTNMTRNTFHQCLLQIASSIDSVIPNIENSMRTEKLELHCQAILEQAMVLDYI